MWVSIFMVCFYFCTKILTFFRLSCIYLFLSIVKISKPFTCRSYLDKIAEEVNDRLQDQGHVTIPELTKLYDLPADFLSEVKELIVISVIGYQESYK